MASFRAVSPRKSRAVGVELESSEAIGARLEEMERKIERLRVLYESFFMGVDKRPPQMPRQEMNRLMVEMQQVPIRNAALRFRFQTLAQRWTLMATYWNRTLREIEAGTYRRDLQKAYRRIAARGEPLTEAEAQTLGIPAGRAKAFVAQQNRRWGTDPDARAAAPPPRSDPGSEQPQSGPKSVAPEPVARTAAPAPVEPAARSRDDVDLAALHRAYVEAHARLALPGTPPTEEHMRTRLLPQLERLRAANPGARLGATVVAENGKLVIRAKPVA